METAIIAVDGMTCQRCVNSLTTVLTQLAGVTEAHVTREPAGQVQITFDPQLLAQTTIEEAIENAGFDVVTR